MKTEELREDTQDALHFDAHEFDGLRDTLEREAEGILTRVDEFVRANPFLCLGIAAAAGFGLAALASRKKRSCDAPIDSRRM